jgi:hypothetical protein
MILLPLLIREKVKFYYNRQDYYRQEWLKKIKIMHKQYRKCVKKWGKGKWLKRLIWKSSNIDICMIEDYANGNYRWRRFIYCFTCENRYNFHSQPFVPQNYRYSSGLNHPQGYTELDVIKFDRLTGKFILQITNLWN